MTQFLSKRWLARLSLLIVGLLILIGLLPTILGAKWIYDPIVQSFARDKLLLEIGDAKLAWFQPLELYNLKVSDLPDSIDTDLQSEQPTSKNQPLLLSIQSIRTDRGLWSYLWNGKQLGKIEISSPKIEVALLEKESNVQRLVASLKKSQPSHSKSRKALDVDVVVRDLTVQVTKDGIDGPLVIVPPFRTEISYHSVNEEPTLRVAPTEILNQVVLTPELVALGLGHAAPLLAKSAWFDGKVSLSCGEVTIPLEHPIDSVGTATITMHQVRTGPSEPILVDAIEFLSNLRSKPVPMELVFVDGSQIDIAVREQTVHHRGLEAGLPRLDERLQISSSGSVGLVNEQLDLEVQVPVPIEQLARRESVQELGVPRLRVPVGGTLQQPIVDWAAMRKDSGLLLSMIAGQLQNEAPITSGVLETLGDMAEGKADDAIAAAADLIRDIREKRRQRREQPSESATDEPPEDRPRARRPLLEAIRKSLR